MPKVPMWSKLSLDSIHQVLSIIVVCVSLAGMLALQLGQFNSGLVLILSVVLLLILLLWWVIYQRHFQRPESVTEESTPAKHKLLLGAGFAVLMLFALLLRVPPSHYIHGGQDQGIYINTAHYLIREQRLPVENDLLREIFSTPESSQTGLRNQFKQHSSSKVEEDKYEGVEFPGFYVADFESGVVVPQFYHLHTVWLAIFGMFFGSQHMPYVLTFFALLSLLSFYLLVRHLTGSGGFALVAMGLLSVNVLQVWVNRYPVSETMAQFFLLSGLYYLVSNRDLLLRAGLAGGLLGAFSFVRAESIILLPLFSLLLWLGCLGKKKAALVSYLVYCGLLCVSILYGIESSYPYLRDQMTKYLGFSVGVAIIPWLPYLLGAFSIVAVGIYWQLEKRGLQIAWFVRAARKCILPLSIMVVIAYLVRVGQKYELAELVPTDLKLFQYVTLASPVLIVLALMGILFAFRMKQMSILLLVFAYFFLFEHVLRFDKGDRYLFYFARYNIPLIFPMTVLFAIIALQQLRIWITTRAARLITLGILVAYIAVGYMAPYLYNPAYSQEELKYAYGEMVGIAASIQDPENSVILTGYDPDLVPYTLQARVNTALQYSFGISALKYAPTTILSDLRFLDTQTDYNMYFLFFSNKGIPESFSVGNYNFTQIDDGSISLNVTETSKLIPSEVVDYAFHYAVYSIGQQATRTIDLLHNPYVQMPNTARLNNECVWLAKSGKFSLEIDSTEMASGGTMKVESGKYLPRQEQLEITFSIDGVPLSTAASSTDANHDYYVIPPELLMDGSLVISYESATWSPEDYGVNDPRELGDSVCDLEISY